MTSAQATRRLAAATLAAALFTACSDTSSDRLLVTSGFTDQIFVLDTESGRVLDSLSLDRRPGERDEPHGIAVSSDGRYFYATLAHGEPSLWKYEVEGLRLVGRVTLPTYGASRVRLSPDGSIAAIPDYWLSGGGDVSRVAFVRTHDLAILVTPEVCAAPHDAAFSEDGRWIAVPCTLGDEVVLLDGSDFSERARFSVGDPGDRGASPAAGAADLGRMSARPLNAAWTTPSEFVVTLQGTGGLSTLDTTRGVIGFGFAADRPAQVTVSQTTGALAIANRGEGTVTLSLDGSSVKKVSIEGAHPHGVAFGEHANVVYVTFEGDTRTRGGVVAIDVATAAVLWRTEVGVFTLGVAYLPGEGQS
jgi:DNA-binding beta-propeller fold protein YncE